MIFQLSNPQSIYQIGGRKKQEDSIYPAAGTGTEDSRLFIVCDGMGGHANGDLAAKVVSSALADSITMNVDTALPFNDEDLEVALRATYETLNNSDTGERPKMGTTMALLYLHRGGAMMAHIGDSRIYHIRPSKRAVLYRSHDDNEEQLRRDNAQPAGEETARHTLTKVMQPNAAEEVMPTVAHSTDIRPGDYFLVCSDGLTNAVDDETLLDILCSKSENDAKKCVYIEEAAAQSQDNYSAWIVKVTGLTLEADDEEQPDDESLMMSPIVSTVSHKAAAEKPAAATVAETVPAVKPQPKTQPRQMVKQPRPAESRAYNTAPQTGRPAQPSTSKAIRNWIFSLLGIGIIIFAFWYVFARGDNETVTELPDNAPADTTKLPETATDNGDVGHIDWFGTDEKNTPTEEKRAEEKRKEEKKQTETESEVETSSSVGADNIMNETKTEKKAESGSHETHKEPATEHKAESKPKEAAPAKQETNSQDLFN